MDTGGLEPCFKQEPGPAGEMGNLSGAVSRPNVHIGNIRYEPMIYAVGVSIISLSVGYCRFAADGPVARRYRSTAAVAAERMRAVFRCQRTRLYTYFSKNFLGNLLEEKDLEEDFRDAHV